MNFAKDRRGSTAIWLAVAAPPMIMSGAVGTSVGQWMLARTELQRAADLAAQAGAMEYAATSSASGASALAARVAEANGVAGSPSPTWTSATNTYSDNAITVKVGAGPKSASHTGITVTATRAITISFPFLSRTGTTHVETATGVAEVWTTVNPTPPCVIAKNTTASKALRVDNMGYVTAIGCAIQSNSSASDAVFLDSGVISGVAVKAVGGITLTNSGANTFSPSPGTPKAAPASDPYAAMPVPSPGACNFTNGDFTAWRATPYQFSPASGVFCGNTTIGGNGTTDVFAPGIYYVVNGNLTFNNAAVTLAAGVTFVLTGSNPGAVSWTNYSNTETLMTAPATGPTAGIVFWQACSSSGTAPANTMAGGSTLNLIGAFYAPCGALSLTNNIRLGAGLGGSLSVVASTIYVAGSSYLSAVNILGGGGSTTTTALVQ